MVQPPRPLPHLGGGGQPDCESRVAESLMLDGHGHKRKSCDKPPVVRRPEDRILIQVVSIARQNCGAKTHSFSKVIGWVHG